MTGVNRFALPDLNAEIIVGVGFSNAIIVVLEGNKDDGNTAGGSINADNNMNIHD